MIEIEHVKSGSVVVKFHIKQSAKGKGEAARADLGPNSHHPPAALTKRLLEQAGNKSSELYQGSVTHKVNHEKTMKMLGQATNVVGMAMKWRHKTHKHHPTNTSAAGAGAGAGTGEDVFSQALGVKLAPASAPTPTEEAMQQKGEREEQHSMGSEQKEGSEQQDSVVKDLEYAALTAAALAVAEVQPAAIAAAALQSRGELAAGADGEAGMNDMELRLRRLLVSQVEAEAGRIRNEAAMATVSATEAQAETIRRAAAAEAEVMRRMGELKVQQSEEAAVAIRKAAEDGAVNYQKQRRMSMDVMHAQARGEIEELRWKAKAEAEELKRRALEEAQASQDANRERVSVEEQAEVARHASLMAATKETKVAELRELEQRIREAKTEAGQEVWFSRSHSSTLLNYQRSASHHHSLNLSNSLTTLAIIGSESTAAVGGATGGV
jgi:hypothetical protein